MQNTKHFFDDERSLTIILSLKKIRKEELFLNDLKNQGVLVFRFVSVVEVH